jgi:hypothetical protein
VLGRKLRSQLSDLFAGRTAPGAAGPGRTRRELRKTAEIPTKPRQARADSRIQVIYRLELAGREGPPIRAKTANLGVGGCFVVSDRPARPGTPLLLTIIVTGTDGVPSTLEVRGEVRWVQQDDSTVGKDTGMGVVFYGLDLEQLTWLGQFCGDALA